MNPGQKKILIAIITYVIVWNAQYFWEYLPGIFDMGIFLLLLIMLIVLVLTGIYQTIKYVTEQHKIKFRLINIGLIALVATLTYFRPRGIIDFNVFEGENILFAMREGVANCTTSIRLKEGHRFKETSICFGMDHVWGNFEIVNDTIKFHYDKISEDHHQYDFAVIQLPKDTADKRLGVIIIHAEGLSKAGIPMQIMELKKEKLQ